MQQFFSVCQLTLSLSVQTEDDAREHLLTIPDDSNESSRGLSENGSQRRKSSAHVSIQNLVEPKNQILKGISVQIKAGQVYCIIGPSGSGKVNLCQVIHEGKRFSLIRILVV